MKPKAYPFIRSALVVVAALGIVGSAQAGIYNWNALTGGTWDTSTANWAGPGTTWVNGNDAVFSNTATASSITLSGTISATSLMFGNGTNNANYSLTGGALNDSGSLIVQGSSGNGGTYTSNPTVTINSAVAVTGATLIGRANFTIAGGTYTTSRFTGNPTSADWANLTISGGTVTATNGIDGSYGTTGSNGTTVTFQLNLNGGTLYTPSIKVADREAGPNNNAWLTFNGTTVKATADTTSFITLYGGGQNAYISNGGAIIDTYDDVAATARNITIGVILKNTSGQTGTLTKQGAGTLTLSGANSYTGSTAINGGTLKLQNSYASSGFSVASGAVLDLNVGTGSRDGATTTFSGAGTLRKTGAGNTVWGAGVATFALGSGSLIDIQEGSFTGGSFGNDVWTNNKSDLNVAGGATFTTVEANARVNKITGSGTIGTGYNGAGYANLTIGVDNGGSTFDGVIQNSDNNASFVGNLVKAGSGTIALTGNNTYKGSTTISGGALTFSGNNSIGAVTANGGSVSFTGGTTAISGNLSQTMDGGNAITITNSTLTMNQLSSTANDLGSVGMAFTLGTGADVTASGGVVSQTWRGSGGMFLNGGTLRTSYIAANSSTTSFLNDRAYIHFNGTKIVATANQANFIQLVGGVNYGNENFAKLESTTTFDTAGFGIGIGVELRGTGGLTKDGAGTLTLSGTNTFSGLTTVNVGALATTSSGSLKSGNALTLGASGTADFANAGQTLGAVSNSNAASNALNFSASTGTVTLASLSGAGNTRFGSNGTVTGGISTGTVNAVGLLTASISGGTVGAGSLSATTISNGTTTVSGVATIGTMSAGTANLNGATSSISSLNGGTVNLGSSTVLTVNDGTTSGTIAGSGGLTKDASGTLTLSSGGTFNYGGATTVTNGKLVVNGNISTSSLTTVQTGATLGGSGTVGALTVDAGAFITPGNSPGILSTGDYNQAGTLSLELNGTTAGSGHDQVNVTGTVTLSGALAATVGYTPVNGDLLFILLNNGIDAVSGTFIGLAQGSTVTFSGFDWQISYNADSTANTFTGTANGNDIALMAVPEPNIAALFGGLGMLALLRRRR